MRLTILTVIACCALAACGDDGTDTTATSGTRTAEPPRATTPTKRPQPAEKASPKRDRGSAEQGKRPPSTPRPEAATGKAPAPAGVQACREQIERSSLPAGEKAARMELCDGGQGDGGAGGAPVKVSPAQCREIVEGLFPEGSSERDKGLDRCGSL